MLVICGRQALRRPESVCRDMYCRVWDMETMVCRRVLTGHHDDILHISGLKLTASALELAPIGDRDPSPPPDRSLGALFATARCVDWASLVGLVSKLCACYLSAAGCHRNSQHCRCCSLSVLTSVSTCISTFTYFLLMFSWLQVLQLRLSLYAEVF